MTRNLRVSKVWANVGALVMQLVAKDPTGAALADLGVPIRSTTTISSEGIHDGTPAGPFIGWSVIEAEDTNAAVRLLEDHPFISRGGILQLSEPV